MKKAIELIDKIIGKENMFIGWLEDHSDYVGALHHYEVIRSLEEVKIILNEGILVRSQEFCPKCNNSKQYYDPILDRSFICDECNG